MFKPKHLYTVKDYYWLVVPTKEIIAPFCNSNTETAFVSSDQRPQSLDYWSKQLDCPLSFIEPNDNFMVIEVDGIFAKVVGTKLGWIIANTQLPHVMNYFEEITSC